MLEHQRTGGASQCNHPISPQTGFPTYLSTTGHQQLLASTVPKMWAKSNSVKHFLTRLSVDTCVPCHYIAYVTFPQPSSSLKKTFPAVLHKLDNGVIRSTLGFLPTAQASHSIETSFHVTTSAMLNKEHCLALSSKSRNNVDRKNCGGWSKPIITKNALHNNKAPIKDTLSKVPEITSVCPKDFVAGRKAMNAEDACVSIKNAENKEGCYNACPGTAFFSTNYQPLQCLYDLYTAFSRQKSAIRIHKIFIVASTYAFLLKKIVIMSQQYVRILNCSPHEQMLGFYRLHSLRAVQNSLPILL